jgi:hypothetical protein
MKKTGHSRGGLWDSNRAFVVLGCSVGLLSSVLLAQTATPASTTVATATPDASSFRQGQNGSHFATLQELTSNEKPTASN